MAISGNAWPTWSGNQCQSVALSGTQWQSLALSGNRWQSVAISGTQLLLEHHAEEVAGEEQLTQSVATSGTQWQSVPRHRACWRSVALGGTQWHSVAHLERFGADGAPEGLETLHAPLTAHLWRVARLVGSEPARRVVDRPHLRLPVSSKVVEFEEGAVDPHLHVMWLLCEWYVIGM